MVELLAPAGSPGSLRAAVQNGAGSVYLGCGPFNARQNAKNFAPEDLAWAVPYCHERGVRVYVTLNTLLTDRELPRALDIAVQSSRLGVDAVLVQDWGLLDLLRACLPDLPLHGSTQMSVFTTGGANELAADGCERIVIARECSREDIAAICRDCPAQIEVFVHGALCVCYSGQCAMSAAVGGRSGNRGRCAQPCRMAYGLDGPAGGDHPLSLKDNCLARAVPELERLGVDCLKLEGRMKRPEYVAVVTGIYARLLRQGRGPTAEELRDLERAFSRDGFTDGYWRGRPGPEMFGSRPQDAAEPADLFRSAKAAYEREDLRTVAVDLRCEIRAGAPASLTVRDEDGHRAAVSGPVPEPARDRPLRPEEVRSRLSRTGGTPYRCRDVEVSVGEGLSLPASAVNGLRRDALAALRRARTAVAQRRELEAPPPPEDRFPGKDFRFTVSVAHLEQVTQELISCGPARLYAPLEELADRKSLPAGETEWCAVLPRVWRDRDEEGIHRALSRVRDLGVRSVLIGNIGHLPLVRDSGAYIYGDFGLNVFNSRSLDYLRRKGLRSACVSFELRFAQIRDLRKALPAEAIVYGRLPLMILENDLAEGREGRRLRDRTGASFPLLPVCGRRTEVQNSRPLWLADRPEVRRVGLSFGRLRFTTERPGECVRVFRAYLALAPAKGPFTRGLYERGVE